MKQIWIFKNIIIIIIFFFFSLCTFLSNYLHRKKKVATTSYALLMTIPRFSYYFLWVLLKMPSSSKNNIIKHAHRFLPLSYFWIKKDIRIAYNFLKLLVTRCAQWIYEIWEYFHQQRIFIFFWEWLMFANIIPVAFTLNKKRIFLALTSLISRECENRLTLKLLASYLW